MKTENKQTMCTLCSEKGFMCALCSQKGCTSQSLCCSPHKALFIPSPDLRSLLLLIHEFAVARSACKDGAELTVRHADLDPYVSIDHQKANFVVVVTNRCRKDGTYLFPFSEVVSCVYKQRSLDVALQDSTALTSAFDSWIRTLRFLTGRSDTEIKFRYQQKPSWSFDDYGNYRPSLSYRMTELLLGPADDKARPEWASVKDVDED